MSNPELWDWDDVLEVREIVLDRHNLIGRLDDGAYLELTESGWGSLVGWAAGTHRLRRVRDSLDDHVTEMTVVETAAQHVIRRKRTRGEQTTVDEAINNYLHDAGVPSRPTGYRWFLQVPPLCRDPERFWAHVNAAVVGSTTIGGRPGGLLGRLREIMQDLYQ